MVYQPLHRRLRGGSSWTFVATRFLEANYSLTSSLSLSFTLLFLSITFHQAKSTTCSMVTWRNHIIREAALVGTCPLSKQGVPNTPPTHQGCSPLSNKHALFFTRTIDVRGIVGDDEVVESGILSALAEYNTEELAVVEVAGIEGKASP